MHNEKKILILYITERSGHHSAALAIKMALEIQYSAVRVACVNAFKYAFPFVERIIHRVYLAVIQKVPKIWETMYDNPKVVGRTQRVKSKIHIWGIKKLKSLVDQFNPNVIVCTQAFPCGIVADYKKIYQSKMPLIGVLTDFAPHSFWIYENVNYYIAPSQDSKELLIEKGVPKEKIMPMGIPIDPKFTQTLNRKELLGNYGLLPEIPVVMFMGGGHGLGPIKDALYTLDSSDLKIQFIVVCGLNKKLYDWVCKTHFKNRILTFRFTDQIDRLMTVSNLLITKPGGITTAEALAKNLPMIILNPIPGQEARNTQILIKNRAALKVESVEELLTVVKETLESLGEGKGIFSIWSNACRLAKPQSSLEIARLILDCA